MSVVEEVGEEFKRVMPHLLDEFDVDMSEVEDSMPGIVTGQDIVDRYGTDIMGDDPIGYQSELNVFVVNTETLGEGNEFDVSPSLIGEETAHWLRPLVSDHYLYDNENLGTGMVSVRDHWKSDSVMEMIGRYAAINCSVEFGGDLDELDYDGWVFPADLSSRNASDIRKGYWSQSFRDLNNTDWHRAFADRVIHEAGFNAAAEQYPELDQDEDLIRKPTEELWNEYNLNSYELDAIRDIEEQSEYEQF